MSHVGHQISAGAFEDEDEKDNEDELGALAR